MKLNKDEVLDRLAERGNVAQFVAFRPDADMAPVQSFSRLSGVPANFSFATTEEAVMALLARASDGTLNVRSYLPESPRSQEFLYGLAETTKIMEALRRLTAAGLHTIVNETVDIHDGGVSGVVQGDVVEFAPDDTPRCVEKPGTAQLPFDVAMGLLRAVYGFTPDIENGLARIEFSIHPRRRGTRSGHLLLWEHESNVAVATGSNLRWPNNFSRHIGDKAYGLLIGWLFGFPVPRTTVISRRISPFTFGDDTGSLEGWIRTCPREPVPGLFTTLKGWTDPFALMAREDPTGEYIASILSQQSVVASYAGAAVGGERGVIIEGKAGDGDSFMLGSAAPETLPAAVVADVDRLYQSISAILGPVRFEWVHDGMRPWLVQLHHGGTRSSGTILVPGDAEHWVRFVVANGLEALRALTAEIPHGTGIELEGHVGLTSHIADVVRRASIPTRIYQRPKS